MLTRARKATAMDSESVTAIVRPVLARTVFCFHEQDALVVEDRLDSIRVAYASACSSGGPQDSTRIECQLCFDTGQMWIGTLHVSVGFRSKGLGRQLVTAVERIASAIGLRMVSGFPLQSSQRFWERMGYRTHPTMARVVTKDLAKDGPPKEGHSSPLGSMTGAPTPTT